MYKCVYCGNRETQDDAMIITTTFAQRMNDYVANGVTA